VFWGPDQLALLQGSFVRQQVMDRRSNIAADYEEMCRASPSMRARYSLEQFAWARMVVASRNFGVTIHGLKTDALVPYADMLNHYRPRETRWTFDSERQCFTIHALEDIAAGDQVFDSYGKKCNSRFLLNYGFTVDYNRDDDTGINHNEVRVEVSLRGADRDPWWMQRQLLLDGAGEIRPVRLSTSAAHSGTREALSFCRFACAAGAELASIPPLREDVDLSRRPILPLSCETEARALEHLARACQRQLAAYPTTLEEDIACLASCAWPVGSNERNCRVLVRGEKDILTHWVRVAAVVAPLLRGSASQLSRQLAATVLGDADLDNYVRTVVVNLVEREKGPVVVPPALHEGPQPDEDDEHTGLPQRLPSIHARSGTAPACHTRVPRRRVSNAMWQ
jgi:histone-lysine N-methyltransferase SETD3